MPDHGLRYFRQTPAKHPLSRFREGGATPDVGKKKRNPNLRKSACAEAYFVVLVDALADIGAFDPSGKLIYPVVEDFFFRNCTDYRKFKNKFTGQIVETGGDLTGKLLSDALLEHDYIFLLPGQTAPRTRTLWLKRWADTTPELQAIAIQTALQIQNKPLRQFNFHIGGNVVTEAIRIGQPLQAHLLRQLRENLPKLIGDTEFGFWFHIEQVPFEANSLHAHGLIYIDDEDWLMNNLRQNERLRKLIRDVTGDDGRVEDNWLALIDVKMNAGNIWYQTKASADRPRARHYAAPPVALTGPRLEARSHSMSRIGKEFYTRMRPVLNAARTNELLNWEDKDWEAAGATGDTGVVELE